MNLFQSGEFTLRSGITSKFKIECDALTKDDWETLAIIAADLVPYEFSAVFGVPRGGIPFADALRKHVTPDSPFVLIADDVFTTGGSIRRFVDLITEDRTLPKGAIVETVVAFAREIVPTEVTALFQMPSSLWRTV